MANTKFDRLYIDRNKRDETKGKLTAFIDQFTWFRGGMQDYRISEDEHSEEQNRLNFNTSLLFCLPYGNVGICPPSYILINGNGLDTGDVYFFRNEGLNQDKRLWRLFSYKGIKKPDYGWKEPPKNKVKLIKNFVSECSPFLKQDNWPLTGKREFYVNLTSVGSGYIQLTADRRQEEREKQTCKLTYIPDRHYNKPKRLLTLKNLPQGYYSEELEDLVSTESFNF